MFDIPCSSMGCSKLYHIFFLRTYIFPCVHIYIYTYINVFCLDYKPRYINVHAYIIILYVMNYICSMLTKLKNLLCPLRGCAKAAKAQQEQTVSVVVILVKTKSVAILSYLSVHCPCVPERIYNQLSFAKLRMCAATCTIAGFIPRKQQSKESVRTSLLDQKVILFTSACCIRLVFEEIFDERLRATPVRKIKLPDSWSPNLYGKYLIGMIFSEKKTTQ